MFIKTNRIFIPLIILIFLYFQYSNGAGFKKFIRKIADKIPLKKETLVHEREKLNEKFKELNKKFNEKFNEIV